MMHLWERMKKNEANGGTKRRIESFLDAICKTILGTVKLVVPKLQMAAN